MKHFLALIILMSTTGGNAMADDTTTQKATFAAGCFWCLEKPFDDVDGVIETISGYTGGREENPTYEQVAAGQTGHTEAMQVTFNPDKVSYDELLNIFWHNVDPFDADGQFCDRGKQYRPGIFAHNEAQKQAAEESKQQVEEELGKKTVVPVEDYTAFWPAENYHQNYYQENPLRYKFYRFSCGRDKRLNAIWDKQ